MKIEKLFGDYTIKEFRELLAEEYKKETGEEAFLKRSDETQQIINVPTLKYSIWVMDLSHTLAGRLYEERVMTSGKALSESKLFKNLFFKKSEHPLNLIGKDVKKSDNKKN